jgi:hypothetical protein
MWPTTKGCLSVGLGTLGGHSHGPHVASLEGLGIGTPFQALSLLSHLKRKLETLFFPHNFFLEQFCKNLVTIFYHLGTFLKIPEHFQ